MDMLPRLDNITQDQIGRVLDGHSDSRDSFLYTDQRDYYFKDGDVILYDHDKRKSILIDFCDDLFNEAEHAHSHASRIDHLLSGLIQCNFCRPKLPGNIIADTQHLLRRMPVYSLPLPQAIPWLDQAYSQADQSAGGLWENLIISNTCSLNILRIAIYINIRPTAIRGVQNFLMFLEQVLTIASERKPGTPAWFIVRTALWTSWQRVNMLYLFAIVSKEIHLGYRAFVGDELASREFQIAPQYSVHDMSRTTRSHDKGSYMCSWAFDLLAKEPCSIGADFRRFHERFNSAWGQKPGRCRNEQGHLSYCTGAYCRRITGITVKSQSAHDEGCDGNCCRLFWDEKSYLSVKGTRAVSVNCFNAKSGIQYCSASIRSLAISHVWSHGQGGRPEDGINECLHKRYAKIATQYDCDSYWWDTACIPESHQLRKEAIRGINQTFTRSKVVLVCDQDIMKIDISECTVWTKEMILTTVLVSDYNVRAWTYLESMRGRNQLYLLCRQNKCINFLDLVKDVWREGSIDIAILSLAARHMLPWDARSPPLVCDENIGLEIAGFMLSYRPASRKGDDLVIWSLLIGLDNDSTAELPFKDLDQNSEETCSRFWKTFVNRHISTGFLLSSAPRLTIPGLTWAPRSATCLPFDNNWLVHSYFDGTHTSLARITDQGIVGDWMMYEFSVEEVQTSTLTNFTHPILRRLKDICKEYFRDCSRGALIQPVTDESRNSVGALIQLVTDESKNLRAAINGPFTGGVAGNQGLDYQGYQGRYGGSVLALLSKKTHDHHLGLGWTWKGIWHWSTAVDYPPFNYVQNVLIS